jgi:hypothetical protein
MITEAEQGQPQGVGALQNRGEVWGGGGGWNPYARGQMQQI